jgi:hypothetical protein
MPAKIIKPLCMMYQNECCFTLSRIASRITWEAASTEIDVFAMANHQYNIESGKRGNNYISNTNNSQL